MATGSQENAPVSRIKRIKTPVKQKRLQIARVYNLKESFFRVSFAFTPQLASSSAQRVVDPALHDATPRSDPFSQFCRKP